MLRKAAAALVLCCACSQAPQQADHRSRGALIGGQKHAASQQHTAKAYEARPGHREFPEVWARSESQSATSTAHSADRLVVTRIAVNLDLLRLELAMDRADATAERSIDGESVTPRVALMADGCVVDTTELPVGRLGYTGPELKIDLSRSRLPKGELTFDFIAHGSRTTLMLQNDERGLRPMEAEESRRHYEVPGENVVGTMGSDCSTAKRPLRY